MSLHQNPRLAIRQYAVVPQDDVVDYSYMGYEPVGGGFWGEAGDVYQPLQAMAVYERVYSVEQKPPTSLGEFTTADLEAEIKYRREHERN